MIIEIKEDNIDLYNYRSEQMRELLCKIFQNLWGVTIIFNAPKDMKDSIARGAKIYAERNQDPIDSIGHYEEKEEKENDI